MSLLETRVNRDVFHWGLAYSSSDDLLLGRVPYRDTYEYYGILTSIIFALAMHLTVKSLVVLGIVTALFYSASRHVCTGTGLTRSSRTNLNAAAR